MCDNFNVLSYRFIASTKKVMWQVAFIWSWGKLLEKVMNCFNETPSPLYMILWTEVGQFNVCFWQRQTEYVQFQSLRREGHFI